MSETVEDLLSRPEVEAVVGTTNRVCYHTDATCRHIERIRDPTPVEDTSRHDIPECRRCSDSAAEPPEDNPWEREQTLSSLSPSDVGLSPLVDEQDGGPA